MLKLKKEQEITPTRAIAFAKEILEHEIEVIDSDQRQLKHNVQQLHKLKQLVPVIPHDQVPTMNDLNKLEELRLQFEEVQQLSKQLDIAKIDEFIRDPEARTKYITNMSQAHMEVTQLTNELSSQLGDLENRVDEVSELQEVHYRHQREQTKASMVTDMRVIPEKLRKGQKWQKICQRCPNATKSNKRPGTRGNNISYNRMERPDGRVYTS